MKSIISCLFGDYDVLNDAPKYKDWDTILFTDKIPTDSKGWDIRVVKINLSPEKESRRYKFLSHIFLPEYDTVCYIDANMTLIKEPTSNPIWFRHPRRKTVGQEAERIIQLKKDSENIVMSQLAYYRSVKYKDFPVFENGFFVRNHNQKMNDLMELTFQTIEQFSHRDQLSLPFACWKLGYLPEGLSNGYNAIQYYRLKPHTKKEKVNVHHITPARSDKNFGKAVNQLIENLPDKDWICLRDIDTVPTSHEIFIKQCEDIANGSHGYDLIGCMTNRLGLDYQLVPNMFMEMDLSVHRQKSKELSQNASIKPLMRGQTVGGLMMLFSKQTWLNAGKFPEGGISIKGKFVDFYFSQSVSKFGKLGIAEGIYLLHLYRMDAGKNTRTAIKHLL